MLLPSIALAEPPDPIGVATVSIDALWNLVATYGWTWGGMALGFTLLRDLLRRNESTHWIAQGRALAWVTVAVGIGITAVQAHFQGAPWAGVVITGILAAFKLIDPNTIAPNTTMPPVAPAVVERGDVGAEYTIRRPTLRHPPMATLALALLALGLSVLGIATACGARQRTAAGVGAFLDCEAANLPQDTLADATALASAELRHLISGSGVVDADALKEDMAPLTTDLLRCAMAGAIAALAPLPVALRVASAADARQAFIVAKSQLGWGQVKPVGSAEIY
jgi:hypothetical protein